MKNILRMAAVLAIAVPSTVHSQTLTGAAKWADSARREIEAGYLSADTTRIANAGTLLERALTAYPNDALLLHYQGYGLYRLASLIGGMKNTDPPTQMFERAQTILEQSEKIHPMAETSAILSMVLGRLIGANPALGMTLGMQISSEMGEATGLAPNNPRVALIRGLNAMFTPVQWGGGNDIAEKNFLKAIELFAKDRPKPPLPAWGLGETYTWLGQLYQKENKIPQARAAYIKALEAEPTNLWVKSFLLPSLSATSK